VRARPGDLTTIWTRVCLANSITIPYGAAGAEAVEAAQRTPPASTPGAPPTAWLRRACCNSMPSTEALGPIDRRVPRLNTSTSQSSDRPGNSLLPTFLAGLPPLATAHVNHARQSATTRLSLTFRRLPCRETTFLRKAYAADRNGSNYRRADLARQRRRSRYQSCRSPSGVRTPHDPSV